MSSQQSSAPRQLLNDRQSETVDRLVAAGLQELRLVGRDRLTIRTVAARAGVSPATAYTYFASRNHLFGELFWRHLMSDPGPEPAGSSAVDRVRAVSRHLATLCAAAPDLSAAAPLAMLATDPEVARLRLMIGAEYLRRFREAIGETADARVLEAIVLAFSGALLEAGMGMLTFEEMADRLDDVVEVILVGHLR